LLGLVEQGEEIIIARYGKEVARLMRPPTATRPIPFTEHIAGASYYGEIELATGGRIRSPGRCRDGIGADQGAGEGHTDMRKGFDGLALVVQS
jgi:hypothetical protein